ncbi:YgjV family protein [Shewanella intestini]|uniref:YgjV family protein n=1 Tax=Shewanella intestini TaxID=2017544 RepID=A0ABS5HXU4_9GAMM|nr:MULTISPECIES: YgjV family protein [Shewanella]MBR9726579.1 YgjV family protein [Shewanella intestini]MRG34855.1 hypothetical protein [Shewanella sp. XMDDZSB0408]
MFVVNSHTVFAAQFIGFVAMFVGWQACSAKSTQCFLAKNMFAAGLTAVHLGLMGSPAGMANQLLNVARFSSGQLRVSKRGYMPHILAIGFSLLALIQGIMWANHWSEWCAIASAVVMSFSIIFLHGNQLKATFIVTNMLNLSLSIHLMSWSGMLYQVITITLLVKAIVYQPCETTVKASA